MQDQYRLNSPKDGTSSSSGSPLAVANYRLESAFQALATEAEAAVMTADELSSEIAQLGDQIASLKSELQEAESLRIQQKQSAERELSEERDRLDSKHSAEMAALMGQVAKLEQENLSLHQQVAARSIDGPKGDAEIRGALASLQTEKNMMQKELAGLRETNGALESELAALQSERDSMRAALDEALADLDQIIADAKGEG